MAKSHPKRKGPVQPVSQPSKNTVTRPAATVNNTPGFSLSTWMYKRGWIFILLLALVVLYLRLQNLGYLSLWVDEFWHGGRVKNYLEGDVPFSSLYAVESNGIVVTLLALLSSAIFGVSEFALRLPVVLGSVALIPLVYLFGRKYIHPTVGILAAVLVGFSPFLFFWSRLVRMYGLVPLTFFALLFLFVLFYEKNGLTQKGAEKNSDLLPDLRWSLFPALLFMFIISFFTGQISFLFLFSVGLYAILMVITQLVKKDRQVLSWKNKYFLVSLVSVPVFLLSFTSLNQLVARPIFLKLMPAQLVDKILPDMNIVYALLGSENMYSVFDTFYNVLKVDLPVLYVFGGIGVIAAYYYGIRLGHLLLSMFVFPFILLGFVFINMNLAKYMTFIYPVFLLYIAIGIYAVLDVAHQLLFKKETNFSYAFKLVVSLIFVLALLPFSTVKSLAFETKHGNIIDFRLSEWFFTNWKESVGFVKNNIQGKKDVILMSTMPEAMVFYVDAKDVLHFRQNHFDNYVKNFVPNQPTGSDKSASSYEDLVATYEAHDQGWLVADYYLYNSMTDPRARTLVYEKMTLHPEACPDGSVQVFSWDKQQPRTQPGNLAMELGKPLGRQASEDMMFEIMDMNAIPYVQMNVISKGIDDPNEAFVQFNGRNFIPVPPPVTVDASGYGVSTVIVDKQQLQQGRNSVKFVANPDIMPIRKGYAVYSISF